MPSLPNTKSKRVLITGFLLIPLLVFSIYLLRAGTSAFPGSGTSSVSTSDKSTETPTSVRPTVTTPTVTTPTVTTPTVDLNYTTIKTFTGGEGDEQQTSSFDVGNNWRISWLCTGSNGSTGDSIWIYLTPLDGFNLSLPIAENFSCYDSLNLGLPIEGASGNIPNGGSFFLRVSAFDSSWIINIEKSSV